MKRQIDEAVDMVELEPSYDAVQRGRQFVSALVEAWGLAPMSDDVSLVTSEIVSNAVIHARTPIELRLRRTGDEAVRIEVRDGADHGLLPSPSRQGLLSRGFGLRVVGQLSTRWGVDPLPDGKMVWAEIGPPRGRRHDVAPVVAVGPAPLPLPDDWPEVHLVDVPVRLLYAWEDHVRDLMREFALVSAGGFGTGGGADSGRVGAVMASLERYWDLMRPMWSQARAIGEPASGLITFMARLPERVVVDGPRFLGALDAADELGRQGRLLTDAATEEVREFGSWLVHAMVRQVTAPSGDVREERCPFRA